MNKIIGNIKKIIIGYLRKSSESREKQALSIASQKREIQSKFPNQEILWIEEEKSAFKPYNRPKFAQMMKMVQEGKVDCIVAWHPDRLSRNEIDAGEITYALRMGILKDLKFISYSFENTPDGIKHLQNTLSDSQYFSSKLGVDVKRGLADKLEMGRMPSLAPVGYLNTKFAERGTNKIIEDLERFSIIRKGWDLLLTGNYSVPQVRDIMTNEWGLQTRDGRKIGYTSAYNMFSNIFYTGHFIYRGITYKGDHTAMITLAEFDRVQTLIKEHGKPRVKTHEFAYGCGAFKCGECTRSIIGIEKIKFLKSMNIIKAYTFYLCGHKKKAVICSQTDNINEIEIEKQIEEEFIKYKIDEDFLHWTLEVMKDNNFIEVETEKDVKESVIKTIKNKQEELKRLIQMASKGFISDEEFKESRAMLDNTLNSLKVQLNETTENKNDSLMELTEKAFYFSTYALIALQNSDKRTKKEIVKSLGMNRTIKDKILSIEASEWYSEIQKGYFLLREKLCGIEPELACKQKTIDDFNGLRLLLRG